MIADNCAETFLSEQARTRPTRLYLHCYWRSQEAFGAFIARGYGVLASLVGLGRECAVEDGCWAYTSRTLLRFFIQIHAYLVPLTMIV